MNDLTRILTEQATNLITQIDQAAQRASYHETQHTMFAEQRDKLTADLQSLQSLLDQSKPTELAAMLPVPPVPSKVTR